MLASAPSAGQSPMLSAAILTNPRLTERLLGAFGEHLAQLRNPRLQMGQAPTYAPMPTAFAPVASAPAAMPMAAYAPWGAYAPFGPGYGPGYGFGPGSFGPGGGYGPQGGGAPPEMPSYPTPSPQSNGSRWHSWFH